MNAGYAGPVASSSSGSAAAASSSIIARALRPVFVVICGEIFTLSTLHFFVSSPS